MPWDGTDNGIIWKDQTDDTSDKDNYDDLMTHEQAVQLINKTDSKDEFEGFQ